MAAPTSSDNAVGTALDSRFVDVVAHHCLAHNQFHELQKAEFFVVMLEAFR